MKRDRLDALEKENSLLTRVYDRGATDAIVHAAMRVINRHELTEEFCNELLEGLSVRKKEIETMMTAEDRANASLREKLADPEIRDSLSN